MKKYYVTWQTESYDSGITFLTELDGELTLTPDQIMEIAFALEDMEPEDYTILSIIRTDTPAISVY